MSVDLGTQIRDYAQAVDAAQEPVSLDEITQLRFTTDQVRPIGPQAPPADLLARRPWLVTVAVAAAVLVLVGGAVWLLGLTGTDEPVATTPPPAAVSRFTWSRVPHNEAVFGGAGGQQMFSVTDGGPGLVAVGRETSFGD